MIVEVAQPGQRCNTCVLPRSTHLVSLTLPAHACCAGPPGQVRRLRGQDAGRCSGERRHRRNQARGKGHSFDCVVGVSGGRDSAYLLHLLVKKHQLRCLAAYYRTPFTIDIIDANVRRLTARLGVPLVEMDISPEYHRRVARELVLLWAQDRQSVTINMACAPCKQVNRELFRMAAAEDIPTIVAGANVFEAVQVSVGQPSDTTIIAGEKATEHLELQMPRNQKNAARCEEGDRRAPNIHQPLAVSSPGRRGLGDVYRTPHALSAAPLSGHSGRGILLQCILGRDLLPGCSAGGGMGAAAGFHLHVEGGLHFCRAEEPDVLPDSGHDLPGCILSNMVRGGILTQR